MSRRARLTLFALAAPAFGFVLALGLHGLPAFGDYHGVYGLVVNGVALAERHATDFVTTLNFDVRALDTLGEEFILFASVTGVALLLRAMRDEDEDESEEEGSEEHGFSGASDSLRALSLVLVPTLLAFGAYLVIHAQLTPGGGFQGGVALAAGLIVAVVAGRYLRLKRLVPESALEALDSIGSAGYAVMGVAALAIAGVFLKNFLPLGSPGHLLSAGFIPINSIAVGLEVWGAFLLVWTEFLDQALIIR